MTQKIRFINISEALKTLHIPDAAASNSTKQATFKFDPKIPLPIQQKDSDSPGSFNAEELTEEQILAGILSVLAEWKRASFSTDPHPATSPANTNSPAPFLQKITTETISYYCDLILAVRPNIATQIQGAAVLKARNMASVGKSAADLQSTADLADDLFCALCVLCKDNSESVLNYALFLDQKADALRTLDAPAAADLADKTALACYKKVINSEPPLTKAFFDLGFFHLKHHDYKAALDALETYVALTCDVSDEKLGDDGVYRKTRAQEIINNIKSDALTCDNYTTARKLIEKGKVADALPYLRQFLQTRPRSINGWFMLGWALRLQKEWEHALNAFDQALFHMGKKSMLNGENLSDENEQAVPLDSENDDLQKDALSQKESPCDEELLGNIYNEQALCFVKLQKYNEAQQSLEKILLLDDVPVAVLTKAMSNLGYIAKQLGDADLARRYFTAVLEYNPDDKVAIAELSALEHQ